MLFLFTLWPKSIYFLVSCLIISAPRKSRRISKHNHVWIWCCKVIKTRMYIVYPPLYVFFNIICYGENTFKISLMSFQLPYLYLFQRFDEQWGMLNTWSCRNQLANYLWKLFYCFSTYSCTILSNISGVNTIVIVVEHRIKPRKSIFLVGMRTDFFNGIVNPKLSNNSIVSVTLRSQLTDLEGTNRLCRLNLYDP